MNLYKLLFERDNPDGIDTAEDRLSAQDAKLKARKSLDSIDDQIDSLILRYEASSVRDTPKDKLAESLFRHSLKYLFEQDELEDPAGDVGAETLPPEDAGGDAPEEAPDPVGSEKMDAQEPGDQLVPDLDIDAFANRTTRLITNYKSLLRMEEAIINRVKNFLDENYGDKFVHRYVEILEEQYGISVEEFSDERNIKDEDFAVGAFAGGTGGLGGGT